VATDAEAMTGNTHDDEPNGAIDTDYADRAADALDGVRTEPVPGSLAIDMVTRQLLFVRDKKADTLAEYYDAEGFDLLTYGPHPYLPGVTASNAAFECYYANDLKLKKLDEMEKRRSYDFPSGRFAVVAFENAWNGSEVDDL